MKLWMARRENQHRRYSKSRRRSKLTIKALRPAASVTFFRTTLRSLCLSGSIENVITDTITPILERVVKSNPMADLVCQGTTQIRRSTGTSGKRRVTEDDTIFLGVFIVLGREGSVAEETFFF